MNRQRLEVMIIEPEFFIEKLLKDRGYKLFPRCCNDAYEAIRVVVRRRSYRKRKQPDIFLCEEAFGCADFYSESVYLSRFLYRGVQHISRIPIIACVTPPIQNCKQHLDAAGEYGILVLERTQAELEVCFPDVNGLSYEEAKKVFDENWQRLK